MKSEWEEHKSKVGNTNEAQLKNDLGDHLIRMCREHLKEGKKEQVDSDNWRRLVYKYRDVILNNNKEPFKKVHTSIHTELEKIATLFYYNQEQTRKEVMPEGIDTWNTWKRIKDSIDNILKSHKPPKELIEELKYIYTSHYRDQRKLFEDVLKDLSKRQILTVNFKEPEEELDKQIDLIRNSKDRSDNVPDTQTEYWNVYIDETGNYFGDDNDSYTMRSKRRYNGKVVAVHVPSNIHGTIDISKLCSAPCSCSCPECLKNWHGSEEKYQELDRIARLISKKGNKKEDECFVLGIEQGALDSHSWIDCVSKFIVASYLRLSTINHKTHISFFIDGRFNSKQHAMYVRNAINKVKHFCHTYFLKITEIISINFIVPDNYYPKYSRYEDFLKESDYLVMALPDAAAVSWNDKTKSIYERAKWNINGLYHDHNIRDLNSILIQLIQQIQSNYKKRAHIFHYVEKVVLIDINNCLMYNPDYYLNQFNDSYSQTYTRRQDLGHFAIACLMPIPLLSKKAGYTEEIFADIISDALRAFNSATSPIINLEKSSNFIEDNIG